MNALSTATLNVARESLGMLRDAVSGLPAEALDWKPAPDANSLTVLTMHSVSATLFWVRAGVGEDVRFGAYRKEERTPAFKSSGRSEEELLATIDGGLAELEAILSRSSELDPDAMREWPDHPEMNKSAVQCLVHSMAHLREHVGQAQLTRDLWLASRK
jgi:uncharacterized damage-inducible protein DinB